MNKELIPVKIFHDFVDRITPLGIEYMLTGSLAMMIYNNYRMTADIDVVVGLDYTHADQIISAFEPDYYVPHGLWSKNSRSEKQLTDVENLVQNEFDGGIYRFLGYKTRT